MLPAKKIVGVTWLLTYLLLWVGGVSLACAQQDQVQGQSPSTADLESQPNTYRYPNAVRRRRGALPTVSQPVDPPANANPPAHPDPPNNPVTPNNVSPPISSPRAEPTSFASPVRPVAQNFGAQNQTLIGPPAPVKPTPEQMAPTPPRVRYENGLLSVESLNSRLTDVLNAIRAKTGIRFEGIPAVQDRVAGKFGPAPADEVLTSLLQGSHFDYVIIGMPENPSLVKRVILSPNSGSAPTAGNSAMQPIPSNGGDEEDEPAEDSSADNADQVPGNQVARPPVQGPQISPNQGGTTGPKTPEQLLEELKRMQQQQQQQQNQPQDAPNQPPGPPR
jgi:hypothetical protein